MPMLNPTSVMMVVEGSGLGGGDIGLREAYRSAATARSFAPSGDRTVSKRGKIRLRPADLIMYFPFASPTN